jgi:hypothetical protein
VKLRLALFGAAAAAYAIAAWAVAPGFFDGFAPPEPYRWEHPPAGVKTNPGPPLSGHATLSVRNGQVDPGSVFTGETQPQASASFLPGSFAVPGGGAGVTLDIRPVAAGYPSLNGLSCGTNVYLFTSSVPLQKEAVVTLRYSDAVPAPSDIYRAPQSGGGWTRIGSTGANAAFYISARTSELGYFAACYSSTAAASAAGPRVGNGNQTLPIIVALAIVLVLLGGIPLAMIRRRGSGTEEDSERTG